MASYRALTGLAGWVGFETQGVGRLRRPLPWADLFVPFRHRTADFSLKGWDMSAQGRATPACRGSAALGSGPRRNGKPCKGATKLAQASERRHSYAPGQTPGLDAHGRRDMMASWWGQENRLSGPSPCRERRAPFSPGPIQQSGPHPGRPLLTSQVAKVSKALKINAKK